MTNQRHTTSPVEQAAAAKAARDLGRELGALLGGSAALARQPWYPPRPGDVVHVHYEDQTQAAGCPLPAFGETYVVEQCPVAPAGYLALRILHNSAPGSEGIGPFAGNPSDEPLFEVWMEAGPHRITVVRDGVVVHNGPASRGQ